MNKNNRKIFKRVKLQKNKKNNKNNLILMIKNKQLCIKT